MAIYYFSDKNVSTIITQCNSAENSLQSRIDDYSNIRKKLTGYSDDKQNIQNARNYLNKKINSLKNRKSKIATVRKATATFSQNVKDIDQRVATRIEEVNNEFYKQEGINKESDNWWEALCAYAAKGWEYLKTSMKSLLGKAWNFLESTWSAIVEFYEKNKYAFDFIFSALSFVAAIVGTIVALGSGAGFIVLFPAIWGLITAGGDLICDTIAVCAYNKGNQELLARWENRGTKELLQSGAYNLLYMLKLEEYAQVFSDFIGYVYEGAEIVSIVCDVTDTGLALKEAIGSKKANKVLKNTKNAVSANSVSKNADNVIDQKSTSKKIKEFIFGESYEKTEFDEYYKKYNNQPKQLIDGKLKKATSLNGSKTMKYSTANKYYDMKGVSYLQDFLHLEKVETAINIKNSAEYYKNATALYDSGKKIVTTIYDTEWNSASGKDLVSAGLDITISGLTIYDNTSAFSDSTLSYKYGKHMKQVAKFTKQIVSNAF